MQLLTSLLFMLNEMSPYVLLGFLIAGVMHAFIPQKTIAHHLSGRGFKSVIKAAAAGIPLPLCSCGVLPTAIAMKRNGASKASTTSFLIATPQTGVDSIAATWSLLGPAFAVIRPVAALVTALFGGVAVGKSEKDPNPKETITCSEDNAPTESVPFLRKCADALKYGFIDLVGSIGSWLVIGLIIAALITVYVPDDYFSILADRPILSMLAVLVIAVPMYVCATGSIPIAMSLMLKGLSPGTALVLLMAGPAANFASFTLISKEMGIKSAAIYLGSIIAGALAFGIVIDYCMPPQWFDLTTIHTHGLSCHSFSIFNSICSAILVVLLIVTYIKGHKHNHITTTQMTKEYTITGMNCPHCQAAVTKAISSVDGIVNTDVNLLTGKAVVEGEHNPEDIVRAVRNAGFDAKPNE